MLFNPLTEASFLVSFDKFGSFLFTEKSGGDVEVESSEYANGSGMDIYQLTGPRKVTPITLKAPWDPTFQAQLDPIIFYWSCSAGTIVITPVNCQGEVGSAPNSANASLNIAGVTAFPVGAPYIYTGCRIKKYVTPKVDRKSATAAMIELEFVVNRLSRQGSGSYSPVGKTDTTNPANTDELKTIQDLLKISDIA
jgi:hypothetical protein